MPSIRRLALVLAVLALASCATPAPRPVPAQPTPASNAGAAAGIDMALVRAAAGAPGMRPAFRGCVEAAAGAAGPTQACIEAELQHQHARLDAALSARRGRSTSNGDLDAIQAQWRTERDRICGADGPGVPAAQRVQAGICRLEATAARADVLAR